MTSTLASLKRSGGRLPASMDELEAVVGDWRQYRSTTQAGGGGAGQQQFEGPGGRACPLVGAQPGRNTKCPLTRKAYKACCGRSGGRGGV